MEDCFQPRDNLTVVKSLFLRDEYVHQKAYPNVNFFFLLPSLLDQTFENFSHQTFQLDK